MAKKKSPGMIPIDMVRDAEDQLAVELSINSQYSLEPDPRGDLKLTDEQKKFLKAYIEFKNIPVASQLAEIDERKGQEYFFDPVCRAEIRRITLAMYYRRFSRRLLTVDEIGGYLTSMLLDLDTPESEKLNSKSKLDVAKMIIELNKFKADAYNNPRIFDNVEYTEEIKDLSPSDLKSLIEKTIRPNKSEEQAINDKKDELIAKINDASYLDPSELAYLHSCSIEELENLLKEKENIQNENQNLHEEK